MNRPAEIEYFFLRYSPRVDTGEAVSIAVVIIDSSAQHDCARSVVFAPQWQQEVSCLDGNADLEMLEALLLDIRTRLLSSPERADFLHQMEDSFSNLIQITERRRCPIVSSTPEGIENFAQSLWRTSGRATGRPQMQTA